MRVDKAHMDPLISSYNSNEFFNSISHLIGTILSLAGLIILVVFAALESKWLHIISFSIYGITLFLSMLASTLLHFNLLFNRYHRVLGVLDHCAIYLLIAGSYAPFCLVVLPHTLGWIVFGVIWGIAIFNIAIKAIFFERIPAIVSTGSYLMMSWLAAFIFYYIYKRLPPMTLVFVTIGGLSYTVGSIIFTKEKPDPWPPYFGSHEIWHLMVLVGNISFFLVMLFCVLPYQAA